MDFEKRGRLLIEAAETSYISEAPVTITMPYKDKWLLMSFEVVDEKPIYYVLDATSEQ